VHTYKHADGSKTKVNQELGEKLHGIIHSTPHRHRADLIQKLHKSADDLQHVLKHKWHGLKESKDFSYVAKPALQKGKDVEKGIKMWGATKRSGEAKALENPAFRKRVVKDKTIYSRKEKHKGLKEAKLSYNEFIKGRKTHDQMSTDELRDTGRKLRKDKAPGSKFFFKKAKEREQKNA
jgi:hypothetical protein